MASNCARRLLQRSSYSAKAFFSPAPRLSPPSFASSPSSKLGGPAPSLPSHASRLTRRHRLFAKFKLPLELGCCQSLMPLHSATASALLRSLLSSEVGQWGCLSEGFATPL